MPVPVPDPPFVVAEALRLGVTRKQLRSPGLHAPVRGVRMDSARRDDLRSVAAAVQLALPRGAAFSPITAAALWDLPLPPGGPASLRCTSRAHPARDPSTRPASSRTSACRGATSSSGAGSP
ncbi:hypothetical protein G8C93_11930 [Cellulosimicrobium cellulans]|uniref:hypothetical protein n=1 Tax=Cellulosimicrobium cellulans TaxID=1710 RepID=UPI0018835836|nr:hypothetical protein [Cellulosimicrobium cellulans]MBE9926594.1 hypothetical protein [Cellulosimicrobium cellulans]